MHKAECEALRDQKFNELMDSILKLEEELKEKNEKKKRKLKNVRSKEDIESEKREDDNEGEEEMQDENGQGILDL